MTTLVERELHFTFPEEWKATVFDEKHRRWPKGVSPVDFIIERQNDRVLIEVKDPSVSAAPEEERLRFVKKMQSDELCHEELVPKARTTYCYLHLMRQDDRPIIYVVVIGAEKLSIQPPLLMRLADRLKKRLAHEVEQPWKRSYIANCVVVSTTDLPSVLRGCTVERVPASTSMDE